MTASLDERTKRDTLTFVAPMPGFPEATGWTLASWGGEESPFKTLEASGLQAPSFVVVEMGAFWPNVDVILDDTTVEVLAIEKAEDVALYVILTLGESLETTTGNLLGPVVVNMTNGRACQMIRTNTHHSTRERLVPTTV